MGQFEMAIVEMVRKLPDDRLLALVRTAIGSAEVQHASLRAPVTASSRRSVATMAQEAKGANPRTAILAAIGKGATTAATIRAKTGLSIPAWQYHSAKLVAAKSIKRTGTKRAATYRIA